MKSDRTVTNEYKKEATLRSSSFLSLEKREELVKKDSEEKEDFEQEIYLGLKKAKAIIFDSQKDLKKYDEMMN